MKRMHWVTSGVVAVVAIACASGTVAKPAPTYKKMPTPSATVPTESHPAVPSNATGFCADGKTYPTAHSDAGKKEQCEGHGGVAEG